MALIKFPRTTSRHGPMFGRFGPLDVFGVLRVLGRLSAKSTSGVDADLGKEAFVWQKASREKGTETPES